MRSTMPEFEDWTPSSADSAAQNLKRPAAASYGFRTDALTRFLSPMAEGAYATLRVLVGVLFFMHGLQKAFGVLTPSPPPVGSEAWIGGIIELFAGVAIAAGLWTTWAAFIASGEMAVAYIQMHWKLAFDQNFFPIVNKGELALAYCFLFLFIACRGGGRWSADFALRRPRA